VALNGFAANPSPTIPANGLPALSARTRLLVVAPHPDDETIATGLLIQQVLAAGGEVRILLLTAGDNNPWPQRWLERRVWIGPADRQRWGRRRHSELLQALQCLGVPTSALRTLDWPDMGVTDLLLRTTTTAVSTVAAAIHQFRPDLVALPALDDRHPDHGSAHVLVRLALAGQLHPPRLLAYLVHGHAHDNGFIEIRGSATQAANKRNALAAHRSQLALSSKRLRRLAAMPERYIDLSAMPVISSAAALPWQPPRWLRPWLRLSVVSAKGAQSWRWRQAPLRRDSDDRDAYRLPALAGTAGTPRFARLALDLPSVWIFDYWGWFAL
jgi:N-acetyl-1-D-myo-inositol-2-amino-2-deoxy-alpha-D-glucopyranoside deacetylase